MSANVTRTLTIRGEFQDNITRSLERITKLLEKQLAIQEQLLQAILKSNEALKRVTRSTRAANEEVEQSTKYWENFKNAMVEAQITAEGIKSVTDGITAGFKNAFDKFKSMGNAAMGFIKDRFKEAMENQISDIQATGSVFGALSSSGIIKETGSAGYKRAKKIYDRLDNAIGEQVKTSTAPTNMIIGFARQLTDNMLPELLKAEMKGGKSIEQAIDPVAGEMAGIFERMALMTPPGYSPGMVAKSVQKLLTGASLKSLSNDNFFQLNPILVSELEKNGIGSAKSVAERITKFQKALNVALDPAAIREMRTSVTGGMTAIKDTLLDPSVGVFSFNRKFDPTADKEMIDRMSKQLEAKIKSGEIIIDGETLEEFKERVLASPLSLISSTLGPFLSDLGGFLGSAGPLMGHVAILWDMTLGPLLTKWSDNLKNLAYDVSIGHVIDGNKVDFAYAIGRMLAEIVKGIDQLFDPGGTISVISEQLGEAVDSFMVGFQSLGHRIDWNAIASEAMLTIKDTILAPGIREIFAALFLAFMLPSVISGITSAVTLMLSKALATWATAVALPALKAALGVALKAIIGFVAPFISIPGAIFGAILLVIGSLIAWFVRYREELGNIFVAIKDVFMAVVDRSVVQVKKWFLDFEGFVRGFIDWVARILRITAGDGSETGKNDPEFVARRDATMAQIEKETIAAEAKMETATHSLLQADSEYKDAVGKDFAALGNAIGDTWGKVSAGFSSAMDGIANAVSPATNAIDNMGKSVDTSSTHVKATSSAIEGVDKSLDKTASNVKDGTGDMIKAVKSVEDAIGSVGAMGGAIGGPMMDVSGAMGALSSMPVSRGPGNGHAGIDYGVPQGTPVSLRVPGNITEAAFNPDARGGTIAGSMVDGTPFKMFHMSAINVRPGQQVAAGKMIGRSGGQPGTLGAGRSTGPHIHFEPPNPAYASRIKLGFSGLIPKFLSNLASTAALEYNNMPTNSDLVMANSSEAILTRQQAIAVNDALEFSQRPSNSGSKNITVNISVLDPHSLSQERLKAIGKQLAKDFCDSLNINSFNYVGA